MSNILLVDLPSILHPIWHVSGKETDVDYVSRATVARIRGLAAGYDYTAICCDAGRSFRKDISPDYKATRPERDEALTHQLRVAEETLGSDGFPVFSVKGFEADDLIATITNWARELQTPPYDVVIASADKDLLQLVGDGVRAYSVRNDTILGPDEVLAKFGVRPNQMRDWLILVGDKSDNVKGIPGVGEKRAAELLTKFGSLSEVFRQIASHGSEQCGITPSVYKALSEGIETAELARKLISLRTDAPIDVSKVLAPRVPKNVTEMKAEMEDDVEIIDQKTGEVTQVHEGTIEPEAAKPPTNGAAAPGVATAKPPTDVMTVPADTQVIKTVAAPLVKVDWKSELEPRSIGQAIGLAKHMFDSKLFSAYGSPQAVLSTILAGRELGIGAMASLRGFHIIDGKPSMSSGLMAALVLRSGKAKQFSCIKRSNESATVRAWRIGEDEPIDIVYSIADAKLAQLVKKDGGWEKNPADMCVARATAIGARLKFQDVCFGLYSFEEMGREDLELEAA